MSKMGRGAHKVSFHIDRKFGNQVDINTINEYLIANSKDIIKKDGKKLQITDEITQYQAGSLLFPKLKDYIN